MFENVQRGHAVSIVGPAFNCTISHNTVYAGKGIDKTSPVCFKVHGKLLEDKPTRELWKTEGRSPKTKPASNVVIHNNLTFGGYYAVSLSAASGCMVRSNTFRENMRGISVQDSSCHNIIKDNRIADNISSGIHLAYGSSFNRIEGNLVTSTLCRGQGIFQAYVACVANRFIDNRAVCNTPKYMLYCAIQSNGNFFLRNTLHGKVSRAFIAIESDWSDTVDNHKHYAYKAAGDAGFAKEGLQGVTLIDNITMKYPNGGLSLLLSAINGKELIGVMLSGNEARYANFDVETINNGTLSYE